VPTQGRAASLRECLDDRAGNDDMFLVSCGVDSCGRPPSGSGRSNGRLERLARRKCVQVDPLFRPPTTWRLPLSPLSYFIRRRRPVVLICKTEHRRAPFALSRGPYRPPTRQPIRRDSSLSALSSTPKLFWYWSASCH